MNNPRDSAAFRATRFAIGVAVAGLLVSWPWPGKLGGYGNARRNWRQAQSATNRVSARGSIPSSGNAMTFSARRYHKMLAARGVFIPERRLDFIESMETLKGRHRLVSLEYDLMPQRALKFGTGLAMVRRTFAPAA